MSYGLNRLIVHRCRASCFCFLSTFNHASTCHPRIQATDAKSIKRQRGQNIAASSSNHESNQPRLAFLFFTLLRSLLSSVVRGRSILCLDWPSSRHCLPLLALLVARGSWLVACGSSAQACFFVVFRSVDLPTQAGAKGGQGPCHHRATPANPRSARR